MSKKLIKQVNKWKIYELDNDGIMAINPRNAQPIYFYSIEGAIKYCKEHKEYLQGSKKSQTIKKYEIGKEGSIFKKKAITAPIDGCFLTSKDKQNVVELKTQGIITLSHIRLFEYATMATIFNKLIKKLNEYIISRDLQDKVEEKGDAFYVNFIIDKEEVHKWLGEISNKINRELIHRVFGLLINTGIISTCGEGYLFDVQHIAEKLTAEDKDVLKYVLNEFENVKIYYINDII